MHIEIEILYSISDCWYSLDEEYNGVSEYHVFIGNMIDMNFDASRQI